jgi:hypothetical protein
MKEMSGYRHFEPIMWSIIPKTFRKSNTYFIYDNSLTKV